MRKLIRFLGKFRDFLIFFLLQIFVLGLFFNSKYYHKSRMVNTSSEVVGWFLEKKHNITKHFSLPEANDRLAEENALLKSMMPESFYKLQDRYYYIDDTLYYRQYEYIPAEVISSTSNKRDNYITVRKGRLAGVEEGMGVVSDAGAVGMVVDASDHYAIVKTILSENIRMSVKHKEHNEFWFMNWDGSDNRIAQINNVNRDVDLAIGDEIVTRGGERFPSAVPVGVIDEIISVDGEQTLSLNIKLSVNFNSIFEVYLVRNLFAEEQRLLEGDLYTDEDE